MELTPDTRAFIQAIVEESQQHRACHLFSDEQAESMREFHRTMANGGMDAFREVVAFGAALRSAKKVATVTAITLITSGACTILVLGLRAWFLKGN